MRPLYVVLLLLLVTPAAEARLIRIPGGTLLMGSSPAELDRAMIYGAGDPLIPSYRAYLSSETPRHHARVRTFHLEDAPVTVRDFARFVRATGHRTTAERNAPPAYYYSARRGWIRRSWLSWRRPGPGWRARPTHPVVQVSHHDAEAYAAWLTRQRPGAYRLPTEAEYEWAAWGNRRWASTPRRPLFAWGGSRDVHRFANYADRSYPVSWRHRTADDGCRYTCPVRSYPPNGYGLYDMAGNVWQWNSTRINSYPAGAGGRNHSMRGCGFTARPAWCRPQARMSHPAHDAAYDIGFRLVWERRPTASTSTGPPAPARP